MSPFTEDVPVHDTAITYENAEIVWIRGLGYVPHFRRRSATDLQNIRVCFPSLSLNSGQPPFRQQRDHRPKMQLVLQWADGTQWNPGWYYPTTREAVSSARDIIARISNRAHLPEGQVVLRIDDPAEYLGESGENPNPRLIHVYDSGDRLNIRVDGAGPRLGSNGLFGFGVIWLAINLYISANAVVSESPIPWPLTLLLTIFLLIGAAMLYLGWRMGSTALDIQINNEGLIIVRQNRRNSSTHHWTKGEIRGIQLGYGGFTQGGGSADAGLPGHSALNLEILSSGKRMNFCTGRDHLELAWLVMAIRRGLGWPLSGQP